MGPVQYVDRKFQEVTVRGQAGQFSIINDAQQNALQHILTVIRFATSLPFIFFFIADYFLVLTHLKKKPEPRLEQLREMVVQEQTEAAQHIKKMGKMVGINQGKKK